MFLEHQFFFHCRHCTMDRSPKEEDRLLHKWFFSPHRLTAEEITKLKVIVNRPNTTIRPFIRDLINNL